MSGLAPFVAATIRDKVVSDQQEEIDALKKQLLAEQREKEKLANDLLYQNPIRTVAISSQGRIIGSGEIDATDDNESNFVSLTSGEAAEGGEMYVPLSALLDTCFLVDGQTVKHIRDLSCECHGLLLCHVAHTSFARFSFLGVGLLLQAETYLTQEEYCRLLGIQNQEFQPNASMGLDVFDNKVRVLSPLSLSLLGMDRMFKIPFDEGAYSITIDLVRVHLGLKPLLMDPMQVEL